MSDAATPLQPASGLLIRRLPLVAFLVLAVMSVGAFFLVQYEKVGKPVVWGHPAPTPLTFDPIGGRTCDKINYRETSLGFELAARSDTVGVYVISAGGVQVATLSTGTPMQTSQPKEFAWAGRMTGGQLAPPGQYYFRLVLQNQGHELDITTPVRLITSAHPAHNGCFASAGAT